MKKTFSENQIGIIRDIVNKELKSQKIQKQSVLKSFGWTVLSIACSFLIFIFMPEFLRKGASKIYKIRSRKK